MKLNILVLVTIVFAITAFGFSGSEVTKGVDDRAVVHSAPQGVAPCGLTVNASVTVASGSLVINASGEAGYDCTWIGMDVYFKMRHRSTGLWIQFPTYSGASETYQSGTYSTSAFDRFRVTADAFDEPEWHCSGCEHHSPADNHFASTTVAGDL